MDKTHKNIIKMAINKKTIESFITRNGMIIKGSKETIDAMIHQCKKFTKELSDAGRYEKVDDVMIETLVLCIEVQRLAFWDIKQNGVMINIDKEGKLKQKNHSVSTMDQMTRSILNISAKLGMSPLDRVNLKLEVKPEDQLDD